ncbi:MAG TPA: EAL domain-containing response regulator [Steroidobacteraceae bacterium]|nr:EAL domain-containing response regulator [Steroidobacteraceae bacterium]
MRTVPPTSSVLVIDDHRFQRSMLARMLRTLGVARVLEAADGASALELLRANRDSLALVVSDVDMPEMDGLEFLRRLAEEAPLTAVAIHSALDRNLLKSVEVMAAEYGLHLIAVLEKPVTEASLGAVLQTALGRTSNPNRPEPDANEAQVAAALLRHEFEPWFQPKIDLRTGHACGAEVLVRWCRVEAEPLPPDRFLAVIASSGLMRALTLDLAAQSARCLARLRARDKRFALALNVCPSLLEEPEFADALARSLVEAGAAPQEVILELTESAAARNQGAALENLARLRIRGFDLSIDDFGTGFSSLAQLVRTPFTELKIDRCFVSRLVTDRAARTLVESIVGMARRLGLRTVAEGIETEAQLEILQQLDCDMGQGYLFAKPMPVEEWLHWMQAPRRSGESASIAKATRERGSA